MTLESTVVSTNYRGDGSSRDFPVAFPFLDAGHLIVSMTGGDGQERRLVQGQDYALELYRDGWYAVQSGTVRLPQPLAADHTLTICRRIPLTQECQFTNQGPYYPQAIERALDRVTMITQQLDGDITTFLKAKGEAEQAILAEMQDLVKGRADKLHANQHAAGGVDPLRPSDIGAAYAAHVHSDLASKTELAVKADKSHASAHGSGGIDPLRPTDIGAAEAAHVHSDLASKTELAVKADKSHASAHGSGGSDPLRPTDIGAAEAGHVHSDLATKAELTNKADKSHASAHGSGGSDPLRPADIGAAEAGHVHSDLATKAELAANAGGPHASTHGLGGSDPLRPTDIGAAEAGHVHSDLATKAELAANAGGPHASTHGLGGGDSLRPSDIGAADAVHIHSDLASKAEITNKADKSHASAHGSGGSDPLRPSDIGALSRGEVRVRLSEGRVYYVRKDGSDANDGLSPGQAFLTLKRFLTELGGLDGGGNIITLYIGPGTWTENNDGAALFLSPGNTMGISQLTIIGAGTNQTVIQGSPTGYAHGVYVLAGTAPTINIMGFKIVTSGESIFLIGTSKLCFLDIDFGSCGYSHIRSAMGGFVVATGNYKISGGAAALGHVFCEDRGYCSIAGRSITLEGNPVMGRFVYAVRGSYVGAYGCSFMGSAVGIRYTVANGSIVDTGGGGGGYFPGSGVGEVQSGGAYF